MVPGQMGEGTRIPDLGVSPNVQWPQCLSCYPAPVRPLSLWGHNLAHMR